MLLKLIKCNLINWFTVEDQLSWHGHFSCFNFEIFCFKFAYTVLLLQFLNFKCLCGHYIRWLTANVLTIKAEEKSSRLSWDTLVMRILFWNFVLVVFIQAWLMIPIVAIRSMSLLLRINTVSAHDGGSMKFCVLVAYVQTKLGFVQLFKQK